MEAKIHLKHKEGPLGFQNVFPGTSGSFEGTMVVKLVTWCPGALYPAKAEFLHHDLFPI